MGLLLFFFFFQAEDGIRDKLVTGVQTCALPISRASDSQRARSSRARNAAWFRWPKASQSLGYTVTSTLGNAVTAQTPGAVPARRTYARRRPGARRAMRVPRDTRTPLPRMWNRG